MWWYLATRIVRQDDDRAIWLHLPSEGDGWCVLVTTNRNYLPLIEALRITAFQHEDQQCVALGDASLGCYVGQSVGPGLERIIPGGGKFPVLCTPHRERVTQRPPWQQRW